MTETPGPILEVHNLTKRFSGIRALEDVTAEIPSGRIQGLIGPNGSGKSTFFNVVSGVHPASAGRVVYRGVDVTGDGPVAIAKRGMTRTFQGGLVVPTMTCIENVMLGFGAHQTMPLLGAIFRIPVRAARAERRAREKAFALLEQVGLAVEGNRWAGELVWVQRQKLQIARAMASSPALLMLDEPTAGMGAGETEEVEAVIRRINAEGVTIMLVSHDVDLVGRISDRITVLLYGRKISEGSPAEVLSDPEVQEAYLGS